MLLAADGGLTRRQRHRPAAWRARPPEAILAARRGGYREVITSGSSDERAAEVGLRAGARSSVREMEPEVQTELLDAAEDGRWVALSRPRRPGGHHRRRGSGGGDRRYEGSLGEPIVTRSTLGGAQTALRDEPART